MYPSASAKETRTNAKDAEKKDLCNAVTIKEEARGKPAFYQKIYFASAWDVILTWTDTR